MISSKKEGKSRSANTNKSSTMGDAIPAERYLKLTIDTICHMCIVVETLLCPIMSNSSQAECCLRPIPWSQHSKLAACPHPGHKTNNTNNASIYIENTLLNPSHSSPINDTAKVLPHLPHPSPAAYLCPCGQLNPQMNPVAR